MFHSSISTSISFSFYLFLFFFLSLLSSLIQFLPSFFFYITWIFYEQWITGVGMGGCWYRRDGRDMGQRLTEKRPYCMAYSVGNKTGNKTAFYIASSVGNKMALLYGLFNWQQNCFIIWLIQLATKRPYYMAYSVDNKTALLYGLFS